MQNPSIMSSLRRQAKLLGFSRLGVVAASPARRLDAYLQWIDQGMHGRMGYLARPDRVQRRKDLNVILPGVRSLVVVGLDYFTARVPPAIAQDPARGRISNYAWGADYHEVMAPQLHKLGDWLAQATQEPLSQRVYVDTGPILERDHAETAGFGFTGKNTMLIQPRRGSWFFLGELLTTTDLSLSAAQRRSASAVAYPSCGNCHRCLDACPTSAFPVPYVLDARRCISYLTIELKGWIPREMRPLLGNWIYGCDICQEVCPFNRFAKSTHVSAFYPPGMEANDNGENTDNPHRGSQWDAMAPPLLDILSLDEEAFSQRFAQSPIKRIKRPRLLRNACVAAGNWGDQAAVPPLVRLLGDPEPLLRGHAAWALHQIGSAAAKDALAQALASEENEMVRGEMAEH